MATVKPRIPAIRDSALTKGLVFDSGFFEGGGTAALEVATKRVGTLVSSGATWSTSQYGICLDFSAAASSVSYTTIAPQNSLVAYSIESLFFLRGSGGSGIARVYHKGTGGGTGGTGGLLAVNGASFLDFYHNRVTTTTNMTTAAGTVATGNWYHVVVTYDSTSTGNNAVFYINGRVSATTVTAAGSGATTTDDTTLFVGNRADGLRNFDGKIAYVRVWNRLLNASEARKLYESPWRFYKQPIKTV